MSTRELFVNTMLLVVTLSVTQTTTQVVLCDIAGCINGICLEPPEVAQFTCNCSTGFRSYTDTNVCEDIDECALDPYRCGYSIEHTHVAYYRYPSRRHHTPLWLLRPSGRCVNTPGSFYCLCYPPRVQAAASLACVDPPGKQATRLQDRVCDFAVLRGIIDN